MANRYFQQLNYTLANEDAGLELNLLPENCPHVVAVCGSGSRIIPLLAKKPLKISVVDISPVQLALCELRIETLRTYSHEEFLFFWGYEKGIAGTPAQVRKTMFQRLNLIPKSKLMLESIFEKNHWKPILLSGRWEKTFIFFSKIAKAILGKKRIEGLFACSSLEEQKRYVRDVIQGWRWNLLLSIVGNARTFNALLYRGSFPENNTGVSYLEYYSQAYQRLFDQDLARTNFFLQLTLLGELRFLEGFPIEADSTVFEAAKKALPNVSIEWVSEDLVSWLAGQKSIGFVSFSNVASYFKGNRESDFLSEIRSALTETALVVLRHYLHIPYQLDRSGFIEITDKYRGLIAREKVQMYRVEVLERRES